MKQKVKRWIAYMMSFCMVFGMTQFTPGGAVYAAGVADGQIDTTQEGVQIVRYLTEAEMSSGNNTYLASYTDRLDDFIKGTESMTWSVEFKTNRTGLQALLFLENNAQYCSFYLKDGKMAFEPERNQIAVEGAVSYADNQYHTAELEIKKGGDVILRMDGTEVARKANPTLLKDLTWTPTAFTIGGSKDYNNPTGWKFEGSMKNVVLKKNVLAESAPVWSGSNLTDTSVNTGLDALAKGSLTMSYRLKEAKDAKTTLLQFGTDGKIYADTAGELNKIGVEIGETPVMEQAVDTDLGITKWHNVALVKGDGTIGLYVDGELAGTGTTNYTGNLDVSTVQKSTDIYCSEAFIYDCAFNEEQVADLHDNTNLTVYPDPTPKMEGYYKGPNREIFNAGFDGSVAYRIPAITTSKKTGTVVAAIDKRWTTSADTGINDTVIRRSEDNGETWGPVIPVIDMPDADAYTIDPEIVTDNDPNSPHYGRIYILVDLNRNGTSLWDAVAGTGYTRIDGKDYQILKDEAGNTYTIREAGVVYDSENNPTEYRVETEAEAPYKMQGALYKDGVHIGSIYKNSELMMIDTVYLWMTYSDDDGKTWSRPKDLTPMVKADWMSFFGVGPGAGVQLRNGEHKGRLVFTMYCMRKPNSNAHFSSYNVYSDDDGVTWHRGGSPNPDPSTSTRELNESCIVELDNGHLIQFMKNSSDKVATAVSTDAGETWSDISYQDDIREVYCEMAVLHYGDLCDPKDGQTKEAIIFANPSGTTGNGRNHGRVRIAFVNEDDTLDWAYDKLIEEENFLYNSLTRMNDGNIGMIYENEKGSSTAAAFTSFSPQYIMDPNVYENTPQPSEIGVDILDATGNKVESMQIGSELRVKIKFDNFVFASGNVTSNIQIGDAIKEARLIGNSDKDTLEFSYMVQAGDTGEITALAEVNVKEGGVAETVYNVPLTDKPFVTKTAPLGRAQAEGFSQLPPSQMTATAGSEHSASGNEGPASNVLDGDVGTYWHTKYNDDKTDLHPETRIKHYIDLKLDKDNASTYLVSGLEYLPRPNDNGRITRYQIEVSTDGETYYPYEAGYWANNNDWKKVSFQYGPVPAAYIRLRSLESTRGVTCASEIRIIGKSQTEAAAINAARMGLVEELLKYQDIEEKFTDESSLSQVLSAAKAVAGNSEASDAEINQAKTDLTNGINTVLEGFDDLITAAESKEEGNYTVSSWARYMTAVKTAQNLASDAEPYEKLTAYLELKEAAAGLKASSASKVFVKTITVTSAGGVTELERGDVPATLQLSAAVKPDNATDSTVVWRSSDKSKATVNQSTGLVTAADKTGEVTITAAAKDGSCKKGEITLTITGTDAMNPITAPAISYTKPEADAYPMPASIAVGGESSAHHDKIHDWSENPVELLSKTSSTEPVKYVDGVWALNDQLMAQESGADDKFDVISGTSAVFSFKLYAKTFINNTALISKGDHQYCIKLLNHEGEGISAFAGEWNEGAYKYKDAAGESYTPALERWADVIWVIDNAGKVRIYVDGKAGSTSVTSTIAKSNSRFAIGGKNDNDSGDNADAWSNGFTAEHGYLADVRFYKDAAVSNISLDELDAAYDTDAKRWAYLSSLLDSVDPTANYTGMPYDVKTVWNADGGAVLAPGSKFEDGMSYTATTTFTAHDGFVFPMEAAEKTAFENEVKNAVSTETGSVTVAVESESVMKVTYRCSVSGSGDSECSCVIGTLTVGPEDKSIVIAADETQNTLQLVPQVEKSGGCQTAGHPDENAVSYDYTVTDAGSTGATVDKNGLVTVNAAGEAVIAVKAALASGTEAGKTKTESVTIQVTKESGGDTETAHTVTFHKNDGVLPEVTKNATVKHEEKIALKDVPSWAADTETHTFSGWYTDAQCADKDEYGMGSPVTADLDLYAKWTKKNSGEITDPDKEEAESKAEEAVKELENIIGQKGGFISAGDTLPLEMGGTALSWSTDSEYVTIDGNGSVAVAEGLEKETEITFTVTLPYGDGKNVTKSIKIKVKPVQRAEEYTVTFDSRGGTAIKAVKVKGEQAVSKPAADPVKKGHTFAGWYSDSNCTIRYNFASKVTKNITLYAKWTVNQYQVRFNSNGTGVSGMPGTVAKKYNETLNLSQIRQPVRNGYKFLGWSRTGNGSVITSLKVTETVTLYAKWEEIPKLTQNMTATVSKIKYKVLDVDEKTVAVAGSTNKKATGIKIPDTVPINGVTCTVVQIGPKAFKGYSKLKKVTVGKNVTTIGKNAFMGCKKLGTIILKGKVLKSVQSGAFKKTSAKLKAKVSKMTKSQKKILLKKLKKGGNKNITVK